MGKEKYATLKAMLEESGIPFRYREWKKQPESFPFGAYLFVDRANLISDGNVYFSVDLFQVEIYSEEKDINAEHSIEDVFDKHDIIYNKYESYIDSEKLYEVMYEIQI